MPSYVPATCVQALAWAFFGADTLAARPPPRLTTNCQVPLLSSSAKSLVPSSRLRKSERTWRVDVGLNHPATVMPLANEKFGWSGT